MKNGWNQAAECLRILSHPSRLQIIDLLLERERTVGELAGLCKLLSHVTSEHLQLLKAKGLLSSRREGRCVVYFVVEESLTPILACIRKRFFQE